MCTCKCVCCVCVYIIWWHEELDGMHHFHKLLLMQLCCRSHVPPRVSKPQCYEWQQTHTRLTCEVAQVQSGHLARLQGLHERISSLSLEQGDRWKVISYYSISPHCHHCDYLAVVRCNKWLGFLAADGCIRSRTLFQNNMGSQYC